MIFARQSRLRSHINIAYLQASVKNADDMLLGLVIITIIIIIIIIMIKHVTSYKYIAIA